MKSVFNLCDRKGTAFLRYMQEKIKNYDLRITISLGGRKGSKGERRKKRAQKK